MDLSKKDKRLSRELIQKALETECKEFVRKLQQVAGKPIPLAEHNAPYSEEGGWPVEKPWHKRYRQLYKMMHNFDRHVAAVYDNQTGSRYFDIVGELYCDGLLTDDDIARFDEDTQMRLVGLKQLSETFTKKHKK